MDIILSNSSNDSIYLQIVNQRKTLILRGELAEGEALHSMQNGSILVSGTHEELMSNSEAYAKIRKTGNE